MGICRLVICDLRETFVTNDACRDWFSIEERRRRGRGIEAINQESHCSLGRDGRQNVFQLGFGGIAVRIQVSAPQIGAWKSCESLFDIISLIGLLFLCLAATGDLPSNQNRPQIQVASTSARSSHFLDEGDVELCRVPSRPYHARGGRVAKTWPRGTPSSLIGSSS